MHHEIREQAIRERVYAIWEEEGRPDGRDREHGCGLKLRSIQQRSSWVTKTGLLAGDRCEGVEQVACAPAGQAA